VPLHSNGSYSSVACVFVAEGTYLPSRCLAMNVYPDFTIPAFGRHVTIFIAEFSLSVKSCGFLNSWIKTKENVVESGTCVHSLNCYAPTHISHQRIIILAGLSIVRRVQQQMVRRFMQVYLSLCEQVVLLYSVRNVYGVTVNKTLNIQ
jgi:hypothetical protein